MKVVMLGAGSAGCGVASSIVGAQATASGRDASYHAKNIFLVDKDGLMTNARPDLERYQKKIDS